MFSCQYHFQSTGKLQRRSLEALHFLQRNMLLEELSFMHTCHLFFWRWKMEDDIINTAYKALIDFIVFASTGTAINEHWAYLSHEKNQTLGC